MTTSMERQTVCVGLCTARRRVMLKECLSSLLAQEGLDDFNVHFAIVDNNEEPTAKPLVDEFAAQSAFATHYVHESKRGIPIARNRLVEVALAVQADWIAFLDDDETAAPDWISALMKAAQTYDADVIHGRVQRIFPDPPPFWAVQKKQKRREGEVLKTSPTSNVIFSSWLIEADGLHLRFDENLRFTGGSDTALFSAAHDEGARIVYSSMPTVFEKVLPSRLSYSWQLARSYRVGGNKALRYRSKHGRVKGAVKMSPGIVLQLGRGVFQLLSAPVWFPVNRTRFKRVARQGGGSVSSAIGKIAAFFSIYAQPYRQIDGH